MSNDQRLTIREIVSRANSSFRYWRHRHKSPIAARSITLRWAIAEWFRRFAFEWKHNR